jgi:adenylate cyclase
LLDQFNEFIASVNIAALSNDDLLADSKVNQLFMVIDFGTPPPPEITIGNIGDCKNNDELNKFINKRIERIKSITTTYLTSWGELFCKTYAGLNCMPRCVTELTPQLKPENVEKSDFLKVYIPSGRKELLKIPWLSDYVIRSLLIKSKNQSDKVAS